jgi:NDP-sugar pyrophosphorylase family protein
MKVLILAGGLGTRLQPIVVDRPKPMAEVKGKPFLQYLIEQLYAQAFKDFVLGVGHLAGQIEEYFRDGQSCGVRIAYAVETELRGTAGAIRNAQHCIKGTFLVLNGDSYLDADFRALVEFHQCRRLADPRTVGTIATVAVDDAAAYGTLERDSQGRILRFQEKAAAGVGWINAGVYVLEPEVLRHIPSGRAVSIESETFPLLLQRCYHLYACPVDGFFVDIGTPQGYRRFQRYVEKEGL